MTTSPGGHIRAVPSAAGTKRPAPVPTLLPAFEPYTSSPPLPRPLKRVRSCSPSQRSPKKASPLKYCNDKLKYPTPNPTSSTTGILSSSPPRATRSRRPAMQRTFSTASERAPLSSVPTIELDAGGEPTLMGRSGKAAHYQLSNNKLISRVHVRAVYLPSNPPNPCKVEILCMGWNGVKIHCQGKAWELGKDSSFTSESQDADIMIDVQDARVLVRWPKVEKKATTPADTDSAPDSENSPRRLIAAHSRSPFTSPLRQRHRMQSPVSPSPAVNMTTSSLLFSDLHSIPLVKVYEDPEPADENHNTVEMQEATQSTQYLSQPLGASLSISQSSLQSITEEFSDRDEENDPIIHSFGPFGANLLPRMASFTTGATPARSFHVHSENNTRTSQHHHASLESPQKSAESPVVNHVVNQLAYSRLSSTPLSTIMGNLPNDLTSDSLDNKDNKGLTTDMLKLMLDKTECIGEVCREGKDAAGKPLESEYYYIPDRDLDEKRRDAVVEGLRKPGLRACRKQHKVRSYRVGTYLSARLTGTLPIAILLA
ncbi:hypothetical protein MMC26_007683 [Xylographa opegraphella]|nr:hypothetical protein [Xylographa opegraphella]